MVNKMRLYGQCTGMLGTFEGLLTKMGVYYLRRILLESHIGKLNFIAF